MELSKREKRKLRIEKLREQSHEAQKEFEERQQAHAGIEQEHSKKSSKKYIIISSIAFVFLLIIGYSVYSLTRPGPYDNFAKCLTEKGVVVYGAMDWCKYTQAQKAMFGRSFKYLNYHEHQDLEGIKITPTWVINGEWHENVQSFERLSALTGCQV